MQHEVKLWYRDDGATADADSPGQPPYDASCDVWDAAGWTATEALDNLSAKIAAATSEAEVDDVDLERV